MNKKGRESLGKKMMGALDKWAEVLEQVGWRWGCLDLHSHSRWWRGTGCGHRKGWLGQSPGSAEVQVVRDQGADGRPHGSFRIRQEAGGNSWPRAKVFNE